MHAYVMHSACYMRMSRDFLCVKKMRSSPFQQAIAMAIMLVVLSMYGHAMEQQQPLANYSPCSGKCCDSCINYYPSTHTGQTELPSSVVAYHQGNCTVFIVKADPDDQQCERFSFEPPLKNDVEQEYRMIAGPVGNHMDNGSCIFQACTTVAGCFCKAGCYCQPLCYNGTYLKYCFYNGRYSYDTWI